jgi:hypothetical protein
VDRLPTAEARARRRQPIAPATNGDTLSSPELSVNWTELSYLLLLILVEGTQLVNATSLDIVETGEPEAQVRAGDGATNERTTVVTFLLWYNS